MKKMFSKVNFNKAFSRLYFVFMLTWFIFINFFILSEIIDSNVNPYSDNFIDIASFLLFLFIIPFIVYFILNVILKIFRWIINGLKTSDDNIVEEKNSFWGKDNLFSIIKIHKNIFLVIIVTLVTINIFVSLVFTEYSSYEEKSDATTNSDKYGPAKYNFGPARF